MSLLLTFSDLIANDIYALTNDPENTRCQQGSCGRPGGQVSDLRAEPQTKFTKQQPCLGPRDAGHVLGWAFSRNVGGAGSWIIRGNIQPRNEAGKGRCWWTGFSASQPLGLSFTWSHRPLPGPGAQPLPHQRIACSTKRSTTEHLPGCLGYFLVTKQIIKENLDMRKHSHTQKHRNKNHGK